MDVYREDKTWKTRVGNLWKNIYKSFPIFIFFLGVVGSAYPPIIATFMITFQIIGISIVVWSFVTMTIGSHPGLPTLLFVSTVATLMVKNKGSDFLEFWHLFFVWLIVWGCIYFYFRGHRHLVPVMFLIRIFTFFSWPWTVGCVEIFLKNIRKQYEVVRKEWNDSSGNPGDFWVYVSATIVSGLNLDNTQFNVQFTASEKEEGCVFDRHLNFIIYANMSTIPYLINNDMARKQFISDSVAPRVTPPGW